MRYIHHADALKNQFSSLHRGRTHVVVDGGIMNLAHTPPAHPILNIALDTFKSVKKIKSELWLTATRR